MGEGTWRLTRMLSGGGRFVVYRAAAAGNLGPGCYVIKTASSGLNAASGAMLRREALAAADVYQRHLVSVVAADVHELEPQLVLPYYDGVTLRRMLDWRAPQGSIGGQLPVSLALGVVRQLAEALAALHAACWLHAQVRPQHVIVSPQGHATLIDLTQAQRLGTLECDAVGACVEQAVYAAPELFFSRGRITAAADTYALGVLLFEALTGAPPFQAFKPDELADCHRGRLPPDIRQHRGGVSLEVAELLGRMLAKEPLRRPSDEQLVRWVAELEIGELTL